MDLLLQPDQLIIHFRKANMEQPKAHPFEIAGMGIGPFSFVGACDINDRSEGLPKGVGLGTCAHCGRGIVVNCIIKNGTGELFSVGSSCVAKTGDSSLADPVKVAVARRLHEKRIAKRETERERKHQEWLNATDENGETNRDRLQRVERERVEHIESQKNKIHDAFGFMVPALLDAGNFGQSMAETINSGNAPRGRGVQICIEIHAKTFGRKGSKAFNEAFDEALARVPEEFLPDWLKNN
jgi:vacuolar-type H+-ATPase subunit H